VTQDALFGRLVTAKTLPEYGAGPQLAMVFGTKRWELHALAWMAGAL